MDILSYVQLFRIPCMQIVMKHIATFPINTPFGAKDYSSFNSWIVLCEQETMIWFTLLFMH